MNETSFLLSMMISLYQIRYCNAIIAPLESFYHAFLENPSIVDLSFGIFPQSYINMQRCIPCHFANLHKCDMQHDALVHGRKLL